MNSIKSEIQPGAARSSGISVQAIIDRDGDRPAGSLTEESYRFLGDEDIPFARYTSREFYDTEMERMWPRVWQWACREEHIPQVGDYYVYDIGRYSIIVVRSHDGIKAYHNSCLHRGTKLRPSGTDGHASELRCPFHGWTWNLEGGLTRLPCAWDLPHVDPEAFKLPEVRVGLWGGFVFINMDHDSPSLEEYMAPLGEHFAGWDLSRRYIDLHVEKELFANWKTAQHAFMENYHTQETHPQLLNGNGDENTQYDILSRHLTRFYAANGVSSPHLVQPLTEQELVSTMLVGDRTMLDEGDLVVGEGETARIVMARVLRKVLGSAYKADLAGYTDTEILDVMEYCLFPNMILFPGLSLPMVYRFRPLGDDHQRCLFDLIFLRPVPDGGERPEPAMPVRLGETDSYTSVPGIDPGFGHVYDQDTDNLRAQQEGFGAAVKKAQTLANYQEVQIRHMEQTLDGYLKDRL
jgi:nitrite reductase/ring-hydroxylating ferredoxin subunit